MRSNWSGQYHQLSATLLGTQRQVPFKRRPTFRYTVSLGNKDEINVLVSNNSHRKYNRFFFQLYKIIRTNSSHKCLISLFFFIRNNIHLSRAKDFLVARRKSQFSVGHLFLFIFCRCWYCYLLSPYNNAFRDLCGMSDIICDWHWIHLCLEFMVFLLILA